MPESLSQVCINKQGSQPLNTGVVPQTEIPTALTIISDFLRVRVQNGAELLMLDAELLTAFQDRYQIMERDMIHHMTYFDPIQKLTTTLMRFKTSFPRIYFSHQVTKDEAGNLIEELYSLLNVDPSTDQFLNDLARIHGANGIFRVNSVLPNPEEYFPPTRYLV